MKDSHNTVLKLHTQILRSQSISDKKVAVIETVTRFQLLLDLSLDLIPEFCKQNSMLITSAMVRFPVYILLSCR